MGNTTNIAAVNNLIEGAKFEELLESNFEDQCSKSDIKPTQIPPKFSTDLVNDTTTSTTSSTSTSTTTKSTSSSTTTVTSTTTTTKASTSATSPKTPVNPDDRSGSRFDGWSFFGGILLTVGISAIGFISFKYYKVRSGQQGGGANYNRF